MAKKVLIFSDWYPPAYKAGGPIRSSENLVFFLGSSYEIYVLTGSTDLNENKVLENIEVDKWVQHKSGAKVIYASVQSRTLRNIRSIINDVKPDLIYLNSMFSLHFTIIPLIIKYFDRTKAGVIVSPRGMLKPTALAIKPLKKRSFISLLNYSGIINKIYFLATDENEAKEVNKTFPRAKVMIAPNFPGKFYLPTYIKKIAKDLSIIFIGRIHPIKNLDFLLNSIKPLTGDIKLDIVGVIEDPSYWQSCLKIINNLPKNIKVNYLGERPHNETVKLLHDHHVLVLPTKGENFGHAIFESFVAGRPVLISDQTPWRNLFEKFAGWDLSLEESKFTKALEKAENWDQEEYDLFCNGASKLAESYISKSNLIERYRKIFNDVIFN